MCIIVLVKFRLDICPSYAKFGSHGLYGCIHEIRRVFCLAGEYDPGRFPAIPLSTEVLIDNCTLLIICEKQHTCVADKDSGDIQT